MSTEPLSGATAHSGPQNGWQGATRPDGMGHSQPQVHLVEAPGPEPATHRIRTVLVSDEPSTTEWLRGALAEHPLVDIVAEAQDGLEAAQMCRELRPLICVIEAELPVMNGYQTCELISLAAPEVATVLVVEHSSAAATQTAMRVGARGCVAVGVDGHALLEIVSDIAGIADRRNSREFAQVTDPAMMPAVVAVSAAKGGVGKTTVAANLAVTMAKRFPDETVLVDLYSQYGDAGLMLGLAGRRTINDLAAHGYDVDEGMVEAHLVRHESGLLFLPGAVEPGSTNPSLPVEFTGRLITALRRRFRVIVLDLPPVLSPAAVHVISRCHHFLVICNFMELTTLRDTTLLLGSIVGRYIDADRVKLIGNRMMSRNRYMASDLEKTTGHPVAHEIPDGGDIPVVALNSGVPFVVSNPRAPISVSLQALADLVDPRPEVRERVVPLERGTRSLIGRLLSLRR
jgi:pilus assembly protein CpaE